MLCGCQHPCLRGNLPWKAIDMDILFLLIPLSVGLVFFILAGLWWAVHRGQFEDIEAEGERILRND
jgi:cbb3-type cytochrome oxidase maturation protein